ncbi:DNA-directed RNA polymerase [Candidatus Woesearchaeota archaeon]|nr:DNA-directed RNA polymerase [Candidatus Woesearchaeota archaeon]MBT3537556.1 DNA-directed RNA polymerase [Candidatus Woesearchaeota archaeon]MBT4698384.1 DNA-directed RNA polymerase [Candidatus Woesearchaeota archaeon]MBT4716542.1 DNA-directed RNA polymerase [Candidatus Woesearchaeota archaeon]MBT7105224.1 DNA-directed RNA polymerase [Candidatus Woesearchaeota archaeon]
MDNRNGGFRPQGRGGNDRRGSGPRRFNNGPREMHDAVCCDCGQECKVPFQPTEGKEVRCSECHKKSRGF